MCVCSCARVCVCVCARMRVCVRVCSFCSSYSDVACSTRRLLHPSGAFFPPAHQAGPHRPSRWVRACVCACACAVPYTYAHTDGLMSGWQEMGVGALVVLSMFASAETLGAKLNALVCPHWARNRCWPTPKAPVRGRAWVGAAEFSLLAKTFSFRLGPSCRPTESRQPAAPSLRCSLTWPTDGTHTTMPCTHACKQALWGRWNSVWARAGQSVRCSHGTHVSRCRKWQQRSRTTHMRESSISSATWCHATQCPTRIHMHSHGTMAMGIGLRTGRRD